MHFRVEDVQDRLTPASPDEERRVRDAIEALSRPRFAGSAQAERAADELRDRIEALGYVIAQVPFSFSAWPGRFGVPVLGAVYLLSTLLGALLLDGGRTLGALAALLGGALVIGAFVRMADRLIRRLDWARVDTADWLAYRPDARPRYLVVAHRDTKSQPVSTFVRSAAVVGAAVAWLGLTASAALGVVRPEWVWAPLVLGATVLAGAAGAALVFSWAGNRSPGALDNASGLAALLAVARRERANDDVAFLITDGEELGLAGARAAADRLPPLRGVINLDGLDDDGELRIVDRHGWPRRGHAPNVTAALLCAAGALGEPVRRQALLPGMMVDHMPLADAGFPAVTVMRGTAGSLRRVHRPRDDASRLDGSGAARTAAVVSGALRLLCEREDGRASRTPAPERSADESTVQD